MISDSVRIGEIDGSQRLDGHARVPGLFIALALLARHPRIDASRLGIMGVSTGGRMALRIASWPNNPAACSSTPTPARRSSAPMRA